MEIDPSESAKTYFDVTCVMKNNECVNVTLVSDDKLIWGSVVFSDKKKLNLSSTSQQLVYLKNKFYWKNIVSTTQCFTLSGSSDAVKWS